MIIQTKMDDFTEESDIESLTEVLKKDYLNENKMIKSSMTKSDSSLKTRDFYELEINLEYDIETKDGRDLMDGSRKILKKELYGEINFGNKKITPSKNHPKRSVGK